MEATSRGNCERRISLLLLTGSVLNAIASGMVLGKRSIKIRLFMVSLFFVLSWAYCEGLKIGILLNFCRFHRHALNQARVPYHQSPISIYQKSQYTKMEIEASDFNNNALYILYGTSSMAAFDSVLKQLSSELDHDENIRPRTTTRKIHLVCWPSSSNLLDSEKSGFSVVQGTQIPLNSEVYLISMSPNSTSLESTMLSTMKVIEFYSVKEQRISQHTSEYIGISSQGMFPSAELLPIAARRSNLHGTLLKLVGEHDDADQLQLNVSVTENGTVSFESGMLFSMLCDFVDLLNFTYKPVLGKGWINSHIENGTKLDNSGQQLMDLEADFTITSHVMKPIRASKLAFMPVVHYEEPAVTFRDVSILSRESVFRPFRSSVWTCVFVSWLAIPAACTIALTFRRPADVRERFGDIFRWTMAGICCHDCYKEPPPFSIRVGLIFWSGFGFLMYTLYGASFAALLSIPLRLINSFTDLESHGYITISHPVYTHYLEGFPRNDAERNRITEWSKEHFVNYEDIVNKVVFQTTKLAMISNIDGLIQRAVQLNISEEDVCRLTVLKNPYGVRLKEAMLFRQGSPLRELFSQKTVLLIERGFLNRYYLEMRLRSQVSCNMRDRLGRHDVIPIDLHECVTHFSIFFIGIVICVMLLVAEHCKILKL